MNKLLIVLLYIFVASCGSKSKESEVKADLSKLQLFSFPGSCGRGVFSPNGNLILALCTLTSDRKGQQIYEFDLQKKSYRRLTWQDGQISSMDWLDDETLVYESNTDELKEALFSGYTTDQVSSEIYSSDRFGTTIERWTERIGYDGSIASLQNNGILYVTRRGSSLVVFRRNKDGTYQPVSPLTSEKKWTPAFSQGQIAWISQDEKTGLASLQLKGKDPTRRWQGKDLRSLRGTQQGWVITEVAENKSSSTIWFVKTDLSCERPLWMGQELVTFADVSSQKNRLVLTVLQNEDERLVLKDLDQASFSCSDDKASFKIEK